MSFVVWVCEDVECEGVRKTQDWCPICGKRTHEYVAHRLDDARQGWMNEARTNPEPFGQWQVNSAGAKDAYHADSGGGYWPTVPVLVIPALEDTP